MKNTTRYFYRFILILSVINILFLCVVFMQDNIQAIYTTVAVVLSIELVLYVLPLVIIYFNYKRNSKYVSIDIEDRFLKYDNLSEKFKFEIEDIKVVNLHLSYPLYYNNMRLFFWDEYFYYEFELKNNKKFIVTCLNDDKLQDFIPNTLFKKKLRFFPMINMNTKEKKEDSIESRNLKRIESLKEKFQHKTNSELKDIIINKNKYEPSALEAAKILLKERLRNRGD